jgi:hypothetical protein
MQAGRAVCADRATLTRLDVRRKYQYGHVKIAFINVFETLVLS